MNTVETDKAPKAIGPYSQAVISNGFVFCSGQIALNAAGEMSTGDVKAQTEQVFKNLEAVLDSAGAKLSSVVSTTVYLTSMQNFSAMNEVYATGFGEHKPARATVAVAGLPKNALVEISCVAAL